jgi:hypothetical protein
LGKPGKQRGRVGAIRVGGIVARQAAGEQNAVFNPPHPRAVLEQTCPLRGLGGFQALKDQQRRGPGGGDHQKQAA